MKRLFYLLLLLIASFTAIAQETPPTGLLPVNAQLYIKITPGTPPDTAVWHFKGVPYGWERLAKWKDIPNLANYVTTNTTQTITSNKTWTGSNVFIAPNVTNILGSVNTTTGTSYAVSFGTILGGYFGAQNGAGKLNGFTANNGRLTYVNEINGYQLKSNRLSYLFNDSSYLPKHITDSLYTPKSGSGNYIQNQNSAAQSAANFWIDGLGQSNTAFVVGSISGLNYGAITQGATYQVNGAKSSTLTQSALIFNSSLKTWSLGLDTVKGRVVVGATGSSSQKTNTEFASRVYINNPPLDTGEVARLKELKAKVDTISGGYQRRMWFNVKDYGAKGDSSVNDLPAFQAAANAAYALGGGTVFIPYSRYYRHNGQWVIPPNVSVIGEGKSGGLVGSVSNPLQSVSAIYYSGSDTSAIKIDQAAGKISNAVTLSGFSVINAGAKNQTSIGILVRYAAQIKIDGISVHSFGTNVKVEKGTQEYSINNSIFDDFYLNGLDLGNSTQPDFGDQGLINNIFHPHDSSSNAGIYVRSGGGLRVVANKFNTSGTPNAAPLKRLMKHALQISNNVAGTSVLTFSANSVENVGQELILQDSTAYQYGQMDIVGNEFLNRNSTYPMIKLNGITSNNTISANSFVGGVSGTTPVISLGTNATNTKVSGNVYPSGLSRTLYVTNSGGATNQNSDIFLWGTDGKVTGPTGLTGKTAGMLLQVYDLTSGAYLLSHTAGTGLTGTAYNGSTSQTWTNDVLTGKAGGQSFIGGTAASETLKLISTGSATKGKILFGFAGNSAFDEFNNRWGFGTPTPQALASFAGTGFLTAAFLRSAAGGLLANTGSAGQLNFGVYNSTTGAEVSGASIRGAVSEAAGFVPGTNQGMRVAISVTAPGTTTLVERFSVNADGSLTASAYATAGILTNSAAGVVSSTLVLPAGTTATTQPVGTNNTTVATYAGLFNERAATAALSNKTFSPNNLYQSSAGTTADSVSFVSSQKHVSKLLIAGAGTTITQAANSVTIAVSNAVVNQTAGTSATLTSAGIFIPQNASLTTYTLPTTAAVGDIIFINGKGAGGWKVAQNAGQVIHGATDTTTGTSGFIASTGRYNCVAIRCITANTEWVIQSSQGSLTIN